MKYIFLFTIGPVQSFISQARKTHDLYAGSKLLSDLIKAAISIVGLENLIFPKLGAAMPNRFLAIVDKSENEVGHFGAEIETAVRNKWKEVANDALEGIAKRPEGFDQQIENFLEIYWCFEPLKDDQDYGEVLSKLERELAAIKNIRPFRQYDWQNGNKGERGRKCSLDGQRNVQFYRPKDEKQSQETHSPLYSTPGSVYISPNFSNEVLQPGEGLSTVSFVKRKYQYSQTGAFKSTVEIALLDAINDLENDTCGNILLKEYKGHIYDIFNAQLFYEDSVNSNFLNKNGIRFRNDYNIESAKRKRKTLEEESTAFKFQKYFAILTFDGDDMGQWWSGENIKTPSNTKNFQLQLADLLSKFATEAKNRLDYISGETVYAGGDDFLGFVNLNHLLPLLKDFRTLFDQQVNAPLHDLFKDKKRISFSAGICVAQYNEPLTLVLQEARKAQEKAKEIDGKDAFAISVIKGSGESHITAVPFDNNAANVDRLESIIQLLIKEEFSNSFIKNISMEFERLMDFSNPVFGVEEMFNTELNRLLKRSASERWNKEKKSIESQNATNILMDLFGSQSTENFFQMLSVIDFFQRELDQPKKLITTAEN